MEDSVDRGDGGSDLVGTAGPSNGNPLIPPMVDMVTRAMKLPRPRSDPR